jgi:hypothetical protein
MRPLQQWAKKTKKPAMGVKASAAKVVVMVNAAKAVVMVVVVDAMAAVVNAAKRPTAKSVRHAKAAVVVKAVAKPVPMAAMNCVRANLALHVVSVANALIVLLVNVRHVKVVAMVAMKAAAMLRRS